MDDLVKRLRAEGYDTIAGFRIKQECADRIEELEAALLFIWKSKTLFDSQKKARTVLKREQK